MQLERIEFVNLIRAEVELDGKHYVECRFDNCTFIYAGGHFGIDNPTVVNGFSIRLTEQAHRTVLFLQLLKSFPQGEKALSDLLTPTTPMPPASKMTPQ